jgi:hypothetical protein
MLIGNVLSSILGQILYFLKVKLNFLFYITMFITIPCIIIALFVFPRPSQYKIKMSTLSEDTLLTKIKKFINELIKCYSVYVVLFWSIFVISIVSVHQLGIKNILNFSNGNFNLLKYLDILSRFI